MKKYLFPLGLIGLFLLVVPSSYAAIIRPSASPAVGFIGVNEDVSYRVIILVVLNYVLIVLGVLSVFFSIKNLVKGFKLKGTPEFDGKYFRRFVYFLVAIVVVVFALLSVNTTMCSPPPGADYDCGGVNIRLTF